MRGERGTDYVEGSHDPLVEERYRCYANVHLAVIFLVEGRFRALECSVIVLASSDIPTISFKWRLSYSQDIFA